MFSTPFRAFWTILVSSSSSKLHNGCIIFSSTRYLICSAVADDAALTTAHAASLRTLVSSVHSISISLGNMLASKTI
ncbi:hypothetical protein BpHYR1_054642 [Brachionus plicatilis]|uniref:Uncharacterized protein n=1 Tax=Brachionus plicatilis TaxID=10195 RepID=A0A3M7R2T4_BRAPC|nr:hypothetical protein BpHYR1_054642 [Brachionus plicatilis]